MGKSADLRTIKALKTIKKNLKQSYTHNIIIQKCKNYAFSYSIKL